MEGITENVIEWIQGKETATLTLCRNALQTRVLKLANERPGEVEIVAKNKDGSICAHIPAKWIKINPSIIVSEERKEELRERANRMREKKNSEK